MIHKPPPLKTLTIRIPIMIPITGRWFIDRGLHYSCYKDCKGKREHQEKQK